MMPLCTTATRSVEVRMGVGFGRLAVGGPAGMADAAGAFQRLLGELGLERAQLALGAAAGQHAVFQRGDPGGVIAAVFEALERIDQLAGDRRISQNSDDSAHSASVPTPTLVSLCGSLSYERRSRKDTSSYMILVWFLDLTVLSPDLLQFW